MAMTGKYAGTEDSVTVTAAVEAFITGKLEDNTAYDAAKDVEFNCCSDGIVIDTPITGAGWPSSRFPLMVSSKKFRREEAQVGTDLKAVYDAATPADDKRKKKYKEILALP